MEEALLCLSPSLFLSLKWKPHIDIGRLKAEMGSTPHSTLREEDRLLSSPGSRAKRSQRQTEGQESSLEPEVSWKGRPHLPGRQQKQGSRSHPRPSTALSTLSKRRYSDLPDLLSSHTHLTALGHSEGTGIGCGEHSTKGEGKREFLLGHPRTCWPLLYRSCPQACTKGEGGG